MGYCANTCARWLFRACVVRVVATAGFLGPAGRGSGEAGGLGKTQEPIHPLDGTARGALVEIVDDRHDGNGIAVGYRAQIRIIAGRHVLDARRGVAHAYEGTVLVVRFERPQRLRGIDRFCETGLYGDVDAARERAGMRDEIDLRLDARREFRAGDDLRHMAVTQGTVGVQVAVPMRVMGAVDGFAARTGAAGD